MEQSIEDVYTFQKELGAGAFGKVKRAIHKATGQPYAVKMIDKDQLEESEMSALQQQVEILSQIDHPNVVKLFEVYEDQHTFYMVLEIMVGGELFQRIVEQEHFSEKQAAEAIRPIVDALKYCHSMGIAHRDLKPENLLYATKDPGSVLKISDFGLARFVNNEVMTTQCGTPGYVAPEIIEGKGYGSAIDYWSVGVILYIMLCGYPPFYSENNDELFDQIQNAKFSFPSPHWDSISKDAKELISGLLTIDPKQRFSYDQIYNHKWLKGIGLSNAGIKDIQSRLKDFNAKKQFKKLQAVLFAASRFNSVKK